MNNLALFTSLFPGEFWEQSLLGNTYAEYASAVLIFLLLTIVFKVIHSIVIARLHKLALKTKTDLDDTLVDIVNKVKPPFYSFLAFYLALQVLALPQLANTLIRAILLIWIVFVVVDAIHIFINYTFSKTLGKSQDEGTRGAFETVSRVIKGILWMIGALLVLQNLGVNITSLIAGLGIGGIAIALAAQNVLGDLFSSFAILFDKPFVPGDFIVVGEHKGKVEKIGIKTSRIRSVTGEEIIISNQELTSTRIQNFKRMTERRATFHFGITYETPTEKMKDIPDVVSKIIDDISGTRADRVHFKQFDDSALTYEVVLYVESPEYPDYMDIQQDINLKIKEEFEKREIDMAYPTQTLYLKK